jgi:hypothetical protein
MVFLVRVRTGGEGSSCLMYAAESKESLSKIILKIIEESEVVAKRKE